MKPRRTSNLLVEPPSVATGDIAFNLIVFFLVCASSSPDSGRKQTLPRSDENQEKQEKKETVELQLWRSFDTVRVNGDPVKVKDLVADLQRRLKDRTRDEDRVVIVKSAKDVPYHHWIAITEMIEEAGGIITILKEEEQQVRVPG